MDNDPYIKREEQYDLLVADLYEKYKEITLPSEYAFFMQENMLMFLIRLARYKFVARNLKSQDEVLEIGCGSGLGAVFLGQHCQTVRGLDVKKREIEEAKSINRRNNVVFEIGDFFDYSEGSKYDVIVALDVIEHMSENVGSKLVGKTAKHLHNTGMLVLGTPSRYSHEYQSEFSKAGHVKLYDQQELVHLVETYYGRTISFSMNDEVVHTGFHKMAWYYFVLAFSPKTSDSQEG